MEINWTEVMPLLPGSATALVGAGGKTALLRALATAAAPPLIVTHTAHLAPGQLDFLPRRVQVSGPADIDALTLARDERLGIVGPPTADGARLRGLDAATVARLIERAAAWGAPLLCEADGSRRLPLKAPAAHEPPIPAGSTQVIGVAGVRALGQAATEATIFRVERFCELAGIVSGEVVDAAALGRVLRHPEGGLKGIPAEAARFMVLNGVDGADAAETERLAWSLLPAYARVAVTALAPLDGPPRLASLWEPLAGVVLAAGRGARMEGRAVKLLLPFQGEPLVHRAARLALAAGLAPVVVVVGAHGAEIAAALADLPVRLVANPAWESGQASSLRAGIAALPPRVGGTFFLLGDQPLISPALLQGLAARQAHTGAAITLPAVAGRRANPGLFRRAVFPEIARLQGDAGGRQLFERFPPDLFAWDDPRLLWDVDTPEDYARLQRAGSTLEA
jgi:molybdenum cofactor cytidylyltransferase